MPSALLARNAPRSDDDPDLEAPAAVVIAMHHVTGAFADPSHETAFATQLFRKAFLIHVFLMVLTLTLYTGIMILDPGLQTTRGVAVVCVALNLIGRILLHRMHDLRRAQRLGSWIWMVALVIGATAIIRSYVVTPATACAAYHDIDVATVAQPLLIISVVYVNSSHGMGFGRNTALVGLLSAIYLIAVATCGETARSLCEIAAFVVASVVTVMAERCLRQRYVKQVQTEREEVERRRLEEINQHYNYAEKSRLEERNEQLQAEKERLLYDMQRRYSLNDDNRSAILCGLQAGPNEASHLSVDEDCTEVGTSTQSDSGPPSLPPGPPSSTTSSGRSIATAPPRTVLGKRYLLGKADRQSNEKSTTTTTATELMQLEVEHDELVSELSELSGLNMSELVDVMDLEDTEAAAAVLLCTPSSPAEKLCNSAILAHGAEPEITSEIAVAPPRVEVRRLFERHVMCDFTPRGPSELNASKWVSCKQLFSKLLPHLPAEASQLGAVQLKLLITEWYKDHPAYAGLAFGDWCKRLTDNDPKARLRARIIKFPFEYTPGQ